jgi:hypothetical protein
MEVMRNAAVIGCLALVMACSSACGSGPDHPLAGQDGGVDDAPAMTGTDAGVDASTAPPVIAFKVTRSISGPNGYTDEHGVALYLGFVNGGRPAQCRVGHQREVQQGGIPFGACPDPDPVTGEIQLPVTATPNASDGAYEADVFYQAEDGQTMKSYVATFYMHRSLDSVPRCNNVDFPTDDQFFAAAVQPFKMTLSNPPAWVDANTNIGALPHTVPFPVSNMTAPFYQLQFTKVTLGGYRALATVDASYAVSNTTVSCTTITNDQCQATDFIVPVWSLRHHIALNSDKTLAIIYRTFESRTALANDPSKVLGHECQTTTKFGGASNVMDFECDAIVLNSAGEGFCMYNNDGEPTQAVFSRAMVAKMMAQSINDNFPTATGDTIWGPKVFSNGTQAYPDNIFVAPTETFTGPKHGNDHGHAQRIILRP